LSIVAFTLAVPAVGELNVAFATGPVVTVLVGVTVPRSVPNVTGTPDRNTFPAGVFPFESWVRLAVIADVWF
jgi:hypothetical protein